MNHLAYGSSHSQIVDHSVRHVSSCAAWLAQKPWKSASPSSYIPTSVTSAWRLNSSDGGNRRSSHWSASMACVCSVMATPCDRGKLIQGPARHERRAHRGDRHVPLQRRPKGGRVQRRGLRRPVVREVAQISTWEPTSKTRSDGRLKKRLALSAPRLSRTNSCSRNAFIPGTLPANTVSRPMK